MSSKTTGERRWPRELSDTIRATPAAASASCSVNASAKWPRWLVANCSSHPFGCQLTVGQSHHAGVVDQQMERTAPSRDEGGNRRLVGEIEATDVESLVPGALGQPSCCPLAGIGVAHGEGDISASAGQRSCGLDSDSRRAAGDDRALASEIDSLNHLRGGRVEAKSGLDEGSRGHASTVRTGRAAGQKTPVDPRERHGHGRL